MRIHRVFAVALLAFAAAVPLALLAHTWPARHLASHAIGPAVYAKMPYDALRDFTHIGLIAAAATAWGVFKRHAGTFFCGSPPRYRAAILALRLNVGVRRALLACSKA